MIIIEKLGFLEREIMVEHTNIASTSSESSVLLTEIAVRSDTVEPGNADNIVLKLLLVLL